MQQLNLFFVRFILVAEHLRL